MTESKVQNNMQHRKLLLLEERWGGQEDISGLACFAWRNTGRINERLIQMISVGKGAGMGVRRCGSTFLQKCKYLDYANTLFI